MIPRFRERLPHLDGLRALAVTFVMAFHFVPGVDRYAPLGSIGVRLFFVLSGFLITRILLESRAWPTAHALKIFYARRALRIGIAGRCLSWRPVLYLGAISYGVYLLHGFMPYVLGRYVEGFIDLAWPVRALMLTTATIAIASVSWRLFEKPLLALKPSLEEPMHHVRVHIA